MNTAKKVLAVALALIMVLAMVACGSGTTAPATETKTESSTGSAPAASEPKKEEAAPAATTEKTEEKPADKQEVAQPTVSMLVTDESEYAKMTEEELYQEALKEYADGHTLVVYSETSSTEKSTKKFEEAYPGLTVEVSKKKAKDLVTLIPQEAKSTTAYSDLVITSDSTGSIYEEWYKNGYVLAYYPADVTDLNQDYVAYGLPITIECNVWYYNTEMYPDGCPITNWWQLLEQNEDGSYKYKLCTHPASTLSLASDFCNMVLHGDEFAKAYEDLYGKPLEYTYPADELGVEPNNAGYEWIYRYLQSSYTLFTDSDEICTYVDSATADTADGTPIFGYGTGIKLGDAHDNGMKVDYITDIAPFSGFAKTKYVYIRTNTDNPAAARLFTLFSLGGKDATGNGYDAYVNRTGCYPTRANRDELQFNPDHPLASVHSLPTNLEYVYEHYVDIQDFFEYYAAAFKK